ncbi:MAG: T9SS type A sorting domain-containing protein [Calditrichaeota bacterium]|nr:T9SS type A sorting domain-containing protein [Calditrichota bacterium]
MNARLLLPPVLLVLLTALPLKARILNVPDDFDRIQTAIDSSAHGDTVLIAPGIYIETINYSGRNITVASRHLLTADDRDILETIIQRPANSNRSLVVVRSGESQGTQLVGLTLRGARTDYGGGIYVAEWSELAIRSVRITDCRASRSGGGLYVTRNSNCIASDLWVTDCQATTSGGGVCFFDTSFVYLEDCQLRGNTAQFGGGLAFFNYNGIHPGSARILRATIENNTASVSGGGVYLTSYQFRDSVHFEDCRIAGNSAQRGGGLYLTQSRLTVVLNDCEVAGNEASNVGGAICISDLESLASLIIRRSIFRENASPQGGAIYGYSNSSFPVALEHSLIVGNRSTNIAAAIYIGRPLLMTNCTIAANHADSNGVILLRARRKSVLRNVIFWGNESRDLPISGATDTIDVAYSLIEGGEESVTGERVIWGEGNLNEPPIFADPERGDYRLSWANYPENDDSRSPGIDGGDPATGWDPDGSLNDIGALPYFQRGGLLFGHITRLADGSPVAGASVRFDDQPGLVTDAQGNYRFLNILPRVASLVVTASGFNDSISGAIFVDIGGELEWNVALRHPEMTLDRQQIATITEPGDSTTVEFTLTNRGTGTLSWTAEAQGRGMMGREIGSEVLRLPLFERTGIDRYQGVALIDGRFYCAGADRNFDPPRKVIHIFSPEGELLDSLDQPEGESRYGMTDIAYGSNLLWGANGRRVFGLDLRGAGIFAEFETIVVPVGALAYDSMRDLIWVCGSTSTSRLFAYSRAGVIQDTVLNRSLRIYGLEYVPDDPDGYCFYALIHHPAYPENAGSLYKFHPETGDTIRVYGPDPLLGNMLGLHITPGFDPFPSLVGWTIDNIPVNLGGDALVGLSLGASLDWIRLEPLLGTTPAGGRETLRLTLSARDLQRGLFEGAVIFRHNAIPFETELPFALRVEPNAAPPDDALPLEFALHPVYPNPFNGRATVTFDLPEQAASRILLFDLSGRVVSLIESGPLEAGRHRIALDTANLPSGVYGLRLEDERRSQSRKVVVLK